ncbi:Beta-glucosidase [Candidatus Burkholderia humilis]|nr:Beta-glucosidase [Candidatus Burkholderia humilis]
MNRGLIASFLAMSCLISACGGNGSDGHLNAAQGSNPSSGGSASAPGGTASSPESASGPGGSGSNPNGGSQGSAGGSSGTGSTGTGGTANPVGGASGTAGSSSGGSNGQTCQSSNNPSHPWMNTCLTSADRASLLVKAMSLAQKIQQLSGNIDDTPFCARGVRHVAGIAALEIPLFRITNGPVGIGGNDCSDKATAFPSSIGLAASFDPTVANGAGTVMATKANNLGYQEIEGPGMNLARNPEGGRNFEYLGEDPFLAGTIAVAEIKGIQRKNIIAMAKHFVANEQETHRTTIREVIDDRVLRELYLLPFEMSVKDGKVASMMCSYNWVNGHSMCGNQPLLSGVLRSEWGFGGFVQSDFGANYTTVDTMKAGMDLTMNTPGQWSATKLQAALTAGTLTEKDIDAALTCRYTQMFTFGVFDHPLQTSPIDVDAGAAMARQVGEQGAVLLKNSGATPLLPINAKSIRSIALIGRSPLIDLAYSGGGSSKVNPLVKVPPAQGIPVTRWPRLVRM